MEGLKYRPACAQKVRKTTFFVNRTPRASPGMAPGGQMGAAKWFLHLRTLPPSQQL